ncbi:hypothetical protein ACI68E_003365 [Malassezia pachydermatis]
MPPPASTQSPRRSAAVATVSASPSKATSSTPAKPMSIPTARRRILWNAVGLFSLWGLALVWPSSVDWYYDALDVLMRIDSVPIGTDDMIDALLLWLRYALTIVFTFNVVEAWIAFYLPASVSSTAMASPVPPATPVSVGEALARSVSQSHATSSMSLSSTHTPTQPGTRTPSYRGSPVSPVPGASAHHRSVSPSFRASPSATATSSPFRASIGMGRPSSMPFQARSVTPSASHRTPSTHNSPFTPRQGSRSTLSPSPASQRAWSPASMRSSDLGTYIFFFLTSADAMEVERALLELGHGL